MTAATIQDQELLLSALRTAVLKCKLDANELTSVGIALRSGMISAERAVEWLSEIGLVDALLPEVESPIMREGTP